jgi:hypothetical protein
MLCAAMQPTCQDTNIFTAVYETWTCPSGTIFNTANADKPFPSDALCCVVRIRI